MCAYLYHPVLTTLAVLSVAGYLWTGSRTLLYVLTAIVVGGAFWLSIRPSFCG